MPRPVDPPALAEALTTDHPPIVVDVRRKPAYDASDKALPGALRRPPETADRWGRDLPADRPVVVYCVHGHEVGRGAADALGRLGRDVAYLVGGVEGWAEAGRPTAAKPAASTLWVTRERPKIDRVACPWLVRRFVDPEASFLYVPADKVAEVAEETGAVPFDVPGVAFSHEGELCSFDAFVRHYGLAGPGLERLALIVRGADTGRFDLAAPAAGLFAVSLGLSANIADDHAMLEHGLVVYDALYTWCDRLQDEQHNWPPVMSSPGRAA